MRMTPLIGFLLFLSVTFAYDGDERDDTGCPKEFGQRCTCGLDYYRLWDWNRKVFITNCTNTGFTDPGKIEFTPKETEVLIFTGNHFDTLPWNVLGIWDDHDKLEVVDLTNNRIQEIQGKTFHKVKNVKRLILNHNNLFIVSAMNHPRIFSNFENLQELHLTNAFTEQIDSKWYLSSLKDIFINSELRNLQKLHLEQNEIWEIKDADMFCELENLLDLHLGDNQLSDINFSLSCLKKLRYLDLEYNKIRNLARSTLDKIDAVFSNRSSTSQLALHGNPYTCDCHMEPFYQWLSTTTARLVNKDEMRCYDGFPLYNAGRRIKNVEELDCPPVRQVMETEGSSHAVTSSLLTVLIILTSTLLAVVLWLNRVIVKSKMSPLLERFKTSMQYSTIEKQEIIEENCPEVAV